MLKGNKHFDTSAATHTQIMAPGKMKRLCSFTNVYDLTKAVFLGFYKKLQKTDCDGSSQQSIDTNYDLLVSRAETGT